MSCSRVAEALGAPVWEADAGEVNISYSHPLYQGMTGHMFGSASLPIMQRGDVNLVCGTYILPEVFPELGDIFGAGSKVIHIDLNAHEIAKNHPVDMGIVADPKLSLALLADALEEMMTVKQKDAARGRAAEFAQAKEARHRAALQADQAVRDGVPLKMSRFMEALVPQLPADTIIFDEALTSSPAVVRYWPPERTGQYFLTRGGSLGVGIPGAIGAKAGQPG